MVSLDYYSDFAQLDIVKDLHVYPLYILDIVYKLSQKGDNCNKHMYHARFSPFLMLKCAVVFHGVFQVSFKGLGLFFASDSALSHGGG